MIKVIPIDIYITNIVVLAGIDEKEFDDFYYRNVTRITDEEYKRIRADIADKHSCDGLTSLLDSGSVLVYIRKGKERTDLVVGHEIFHAVNKVLCRAGVNHDADAEPWAYLMGWLFNEYYNALDDYENENK